MQRFQNKGVLSGRPRLSDLLRRRQQALAQFATELRLRDDKALSAHCEAFGVEKDMVLPLPEVIVTDRVDSMSTEAIVQAVADNVERPTKKKRTRNALVSLTDLVHDPSSSGEG